MIFPEIAAPRAPAGGLPPKSARPPCPGARKKGPPGFRGNAKGGSAPRPGAGAGRRHLAGAGAEPPRTAFAAFDAPADRGRPANPALGRGW